MRDMLHVVSATLVLVVATSSVAYSQGTAAAEAKQPEPAKAGPHDAELAAIRAQSQAFVDAFNQKDAKAIAALWTEDGEFVSDAGRRYAGRAEIEKAYAGLFEANPESKLRMAVEELRVLSSVTAIEDGRALVEPPPAGNPGVSRYTAVHTKVDGKWLMASVRDTWVETPDDEQSSADLEWLVGAWDAEEHGIRMNFVCSWTVGNRFLERRYTTTLLNGTTVSGVQLIGWNPMERHVQSWDFSPDGGHSVGRWVPTENGWQAEVHGMTGTGVPTAAINVLRRLDDNAYAWQSVQRQVGDVALPDTDEVIIKRRPTP